MSDKLDLVEVTNLPVTDAGTNAAADANAVVPNVAVPPAGIDVAIPAPLRRRVRKDGDEAETLLNEESVPVDEVPAEASEQVQAAAAGQAAAGAAGAAGGQAAAASSIGGFLSTAGLALNPLIIAGAVAAAVGVAAVATGGDSGPPANQGPSAGADTAVATEDGAAVTGSIATNDSDPENDALTFALNTPVAGLTVSANGGWSFDASHAAYQDLGVGETRVVTANYTVSDGKGGTATSTLTITVSGANDGPTAVADTFAVVEDAAVVTGSVAANDRDVDGDVLTYALTEPVAGLTFNADGSYRFDPSDAAYQDLGAGETRDIVVRYFVSDGHGGTAESALTIRVTGVADVPPNRDPVANSDTFDTTREGDLLRGSVTRNDSDPDGDVLTYRLLDEAPGLVMNADGSFTFDPTHPDYRSIPATGSRELLVEYEVSDGRGGFATARLLIDVYGINDAPTAQAVSMTAAEDGAVVRGTLAGADPDDGDVLTYILPDPTPPGLTFDAGGGYAFDPSHAAYQGLAAGEVRAIVTTYSVVDPSGAMTTAALTITVTGTNDAPVAVADVATAIEDGPVVSGSVGINDGDMDGDPLSYSMVFSLVSPIAGLTFNTDGSYSFDASDPAYQDLDQGQTRTIVAAYTVSDGHGGVSTSTLTITVSGQYDRPNVAPVVVDDVAAASEGGSAVTGSVAANDIDADGDVLRYAVITGAPGLTLNPDGSYSFDPGHAAYQNLGEGQTRVVEASYVVTDGFGGRVNSTLAITVTGTNDAPYAVIDATEALEDEGTVTGSVAANDGDVDAGAVLTYALVAPVTGLTMSANGGYSLNLNSAVYQSLAQGQTMDLVVPYTVTDQHGATTSSTLTITITGMNDAPVANPEAWTTTEDGVPLAGNVRGNDGDVDQGAQRTYSLNAPVPGLTLDADGSWSFNPGDAAYQDLAPGQTRDVVATYTLTDEHGARATATLTITVTGVNDAPVAQPDSLTVHEDAGLVSGSVAANDSDTDAGRVLTYALVGSATGLSMGANGSYTFNTSHPEYQTLPLGQTREISVTYSVTDQYGAQAQAVLTLTITGANDHPTVTAETAAVTEDAAAITGSVAGNDSDVDTGSSLSYGLVTPVAGLTMDSNGSWSFDPGDAAYDDIGNGQTRDAVAEYTVTDEHGASTTSTLTITVTGANSAPTARGEHVETTEDLYIVGSLAGNDTDPDPGAVLRYDLVTPVPGLSVNRNTGGYTFDPTDDAYDYLTAGQVHVMSVEYIVSDGQGGTATARLAIRLVGTNDAPTAILDTAGATEDGALITGSVATNDSDPDSTGALVYAPITSPAGLIFNTDGSYSFDPGNAAYQSIPAGTTRDVVVRYRVTDPSGASSESSLTITVTGVADAPVGVADSYAVAEDGVLTIHRSSGVLANDRDPDGETITAHLVTGPAHGVLTLNADGSFTYTPAGAYSGADSFTYVARDAHGDSAPVTVNLTVAPVNDAAVSFATTGTEIGRVGGNELVNTTILGDQSDSVVGGLAGGGFVVAWTDYSQRGGDAFNTSVKAQRYDAAGQPVGGEFLVNTVTPDYQFDPKVTGLVGGRFIVTWQSLTDVKAQVFEADGTRVGGEFTANPETNGTQIESNVTALRGGGFVVTWTDLSGREEGFGIRAQMYDANGALVGGEIVVNADPTGDQRYPDVSALPGGGFVVCWSNEQTGAVEIRRFDAAGAPDGGEITIPNTPESYLTEPELTGLASGGFVVSWMEYRGFSASVHVQLYDGAGNEVGPSVVAEDTTPSNQSSPSITALADGGYVLVWSDYNEQSGDGSGGAVKVQRFDASGTRIGEPFICNTITGDDQGRPQIDALADGGFAITWTDNSGVDDHSGAGVRVQVFGPLPAFSATEQEALDLKGKISIVDDAGAPEITVVLTVDHGILDMSAGSSGASIAGSGTSSVTITGSRAQINALLNGDLTSIARYTSTGDTPPASAVLNVAIYNGATPIGVGAQVIAIREVNDAPVAGADLELVTEDGPLLVGSLATNDHDPDGDTLHYSWDNDVAGFTLNDDGSYSFDPAEWQGVPGGTTVDIPISYTVYDDRGGFSNEVFTIRITGTNDVPTAQALAVARTQSRFDYIGDVFTDDADDNSTLTHTLVGDIPPGLSITPSGSYRFNSSGYAWLAAGQTTVVRATYRVTDEQGAWAESTIAITLTGTNDAPTVSFSGPFAATEQVPLDLKGKIITGDVDTGATMTATLEVPYGVLLLDAGGSGATVSGSGTGTVVITGTAAQVEALLRSDAASTVSYIAGTDTPPATVRLTVTVNDGSTSAVREQDITITDTPGFAPNGSAAERYREGGADDAARGDLFDDGLVPVGEFGIAATRQGAFADHGLDLTQVFSENGEDELGLLLGAMDPGGGEAVPLALTPDDFAIPDGFVGLDPLDPLLAPIHAVV